MVSPELSVKQIVKALGLEPLPAEGGLFRQTYRSAEEFPALALPQRYSGENKPFGTAIFYLLTDAPDSFSEFHRLPTDEIFHFYLGDPLEVTLLFPSGESRQILLGQDILQKQHLQYTVPRGVWQGSRVAPGGQFSLIGTTMAPGYTPGDYERGSREALLRQYPHQAEKIRLLTRVAAR
jgi:predicted cupin superfamily sugar epimerase